MSGGITNVADILRVHSADTPDEVVLVQDDRTVTWAELRDRAGRVAQALLAEGVGNQDRIAFLDKNGIEHFEVFYGAALLNAVCVDVNWRLAAPEVAYIVNDAAARVFVVGPDFVPVLDAMRHEATFINAVLHRDPEDPTHFMLYETWADRDDLVGVQMKRDYRAAYEASLPDILREPRQVRIWRPLRADFTFLAR